MPDQTRTRTAVTGIRPQVDELIRLRFAARGLALTPRRPVGATTVGVYRSRFRGRGVDYLESRNYQPGDDIRNMDWRVTARTGKPHTKLFQEERERPVIVLLDCGPSMFFGTRQTLKSTLAAHLAACIGWAAVQHGDRIGAFGFAADMHQEMRPVGGRRGALALIRHLLAWLQPPVHASELADALASHTSERAGQALTLALKRLRHVTRPGSLVFILSDFYGLNQDTRRHLSHLCRHNDVAACQIYDPIEIQPPPPGVYPISNGVQSGLLNTLARDSRQRYQDYADQHFEQLRQMTRQLGMPLQSAATTDDPVVIMQRLLNV